METKRTLRNRLENAQRRADTEHQNAVQAIKLLQEEQDDNAALRKHVTELKEALAERENPEPLEGHTRIQLWGERCDVPDTVSVKVRTERSVYGFPVAYDLDVPI
jgi:hypothetical protein